MLIQPTIRKFGVTDAEAEHLLELIPALGQTRDDQGRSLLHAPIREVRVFPAGVVVQLVCGHWYAAYRSAAMRPPSAIGGKPTAEQLFPYGALHDDRLCPFSAGPWVRMTAPKAVWE